MDFTAWFEAYLGGQWYTFDARNNRPRIGRVLMARGRDAADVAISTSFGPNTLNSFTVLTKKSQRWNDPGLVLRHRGCASGSETIIPPESVMEYRASELAAETHGGHRSGVHARFGHRGRHHRSGCFPTDFLGEPRLFGLPCRDARLLGSLQPRLPHISTRSFFVNLIMPRSF